MPAIPVPNVGEPTYQTWAQAVADKLNTPYFVMTSGFYTFNSNGRLNASKGQIAPGLATLDGWVTAGSTNVSQFCRVTATHDGVDLVALYAEVTAGAGAAWGVAANLSVRVQAYCWGTPMSTAELLEAGLRPVVIPEA